jgi:MtN3 and saliva related transmembrane protein
LTAKTACLKGKVNSAGAQNWATMDIVTAVGLVAATFTTVSLFPQLQKSWKTRHKPSKDSTIVRFSTLFCFGIFMWLIYGIWKLDIPMIVANALSFLQGLLILIIQVRRLQIKPGSLFRKVTD